MDQKFFLQPFAFAGDKTAIPDALQPSGTVSFNQGFGFDYERELGVDPLAKATPRQEMNYLLGALTDNVGVWQRYAFPEFITAANNAGAAFPYARGSIVRYRATGGDPFGYFISRVDNNTATPVAGANWAPYVFEVATNAQALAGTDDATMMTPLKVAQAIAATAVVVPDATETVKGKAELATAAEAVAGADTTRIVTPAGLAAALANYVPAASTTVVGKTRLATTAEATTGASQAIAVTPAGLKTVADTKLNGSGGKMTGNLTTQLNNGAHFFTSADGASKQWVIQAVITDTVDSGFMFKYWTGAAYATAATVTTGGLAVTGICTASGGFGPTSSRHLKDFSDAPFGYALETFERIHVGRGKYKPQFNDDGRERLFFDAEQLREVVPEAELPNATTLDGIAYPGVDLTQLAPLMARALAEASREIRALQARVALLESED